MVSRGIIPIPIHNFQVNKFWHKDVEIDGVATNDKNDVVFVEIKFVPEVDGIKIYNELKYKSLSVNIKRNKEYYMIIAKSFKTKSNEAINVDFAGIDRIIKKLNE